MFHIPMVPRSAPLTTEDLEATCVWYGDGIYQLHFSEDETLHYLGQTVQPKLYPVYLPAGIPCKTIPLSGNVLYRKNNKHWFFSATYHVADLQSPGDTLDALFFHEHKPVIQWLRFLATEDPHLEEPSVDCLFYTVEGDHICVFGAPAYTERIHVPAKINGLPVRHVRLPKKQIGKNVHEIVIEDGVETALIPFDLPFLKTIQIPDSVTLLAPPNGIQQTLWYQDQPDGDIYFHGHYCGTKHPSNQVLQQDD